MAYHDPCYLGRYNEVYDEPREVLDQAEGGYVELPRCRDQGFCCGAGGARAFMEEKRGTRISHNRLNEALETERRRRRRGLPVLRDDVRGRRPRPERRGALRRSRTSPRSSPRRCPPTAKPPP